MPKPEPSPDVSPSPTEARFLGYPEGRLADAWTLQDICAFLKVSERKARPLMKSPGAPAPLRLLSARCDRWNAYQVLAWLHGVSDPTGSTTSPPSSSRQSADPTTAGGVPTGGAPGAPWRPAEPRARRRKDGLRP